MFSSIIMFGLIVLLIILFINLIDMIKWISNKIKRAKTNKINKINKNKVALTYDLVYRKRRSGVVNLRIHW